MFWSKIRSLRKKLTQHSLLSLDLQKSNWLFHLKSTTNFVYNLVFGYGGQQNAEFLFCRKYVQL